MADLRRIVDVIRSILYSDVDPDPAHLRLLADEHRAACTEVNEQLRACDDLLHRGLRDEAIQRAEAADLLERVAVLDFPERQEWADYVSSSGLSLPPKLEIDRAADLNEAYSAQQSLEPLLRLMRLNNLAKSPLPQRIAILRRIERKDGNNPIWATSLRDFERERQRQIRNDVVEAIRSKDVKTLATLEQELRSPDWKTAPPKALLRQASDGHTKLRQDRARKEMQVLQGELNDAYADFDVARGRKARSRWNALSAMIDFEGDDAELLDLVGPALGWLNDLDVSEAAQQAYAAKLAQLRSKLDEWIHDPSEYESLKSLEENLRATDEGIPIVEQTQLNERYLQFQQAQAGARRWKVIGAVSAVVMLAVLTGFGVMLLLQSSERSQIVASLDALMQEGNLDGADAFLDKLESSDPGAYGDARVQKIRQALDLAITDEQARQQLFESKLQEARRVGLDQPSWDGIAAAREILASAGEIARRESEKLAFNELGGQLRDAERALLKAEEDSFLAEAERLQSRYEKVMRDDLPQLEQLHEAYGRLLAWDHVPEEIKRTPAELQKRIAGQLDGLRRMQRQARVYEQVTIAVGQRQAFEARLMAAKVDSALAGNRQAQEIDTVLSSDPRIWIGLEAWNDFIADVEDIDLATITPDEAARLMARSAKLISDHPGFPGEAQSKKLEQMLTPVTQRLTAGDQRTDAGVIDVLTHVTIQQVYYLKTITGEWYYSPKQPIETGGNEFRSVLYYKNLNLDKVSKQIRVSEIANPRAGTSFDWLSPQSAFSRDALKLYRGLTVSNWDATYLEILSRLLNDHDMDPVFKYQLLQALVPPALHGSWPLQQGFAKHEELLTAGTVNTQENYFDPAGEESAEVRRASQGVLDQLPDLSKSVAAAQSAMQQLKEFRVADRYQWLGWLHLDHKGQWVCDVPKRLKPPEDQSGELFMVYATSATTPPEFKAVGKLKAGQMQLAEPPDGFMAGRPVFLAISSD